MNKYKSLIITFIILSCTRYGSIQEQENKISNGYLINLQTVHNNTFFLCNDMPLILPVNDSGGGYRNIAKSLINQGCYPVGMGLSPEYELGCRNKSIAGYYFANKDSVFEKDLIDIQKSIANRDSFLYNSTNFRYDTLNTKEYLRIGTLQIKYEGWKCKNFRVFDTAINYTDMIYYIDKIHSSISPSSSSEDTTAQ